MSNARGRVQSRASKWGWGILLAVSAGLAVNGVGLFFFIAGSPSTFEQDTGVPLNEVRQAFPTVADYVASLGRNISILLTGLGLLALVVSLEGFRHGSRWAWNATWVLVAVLTVSGVRMLVEGEPPIGLMYLFLAAVALVGQLLARRGLAS